MNSRLVQIPTLLIASLCFVVVAIWYFAVYQRREVLDRRMQELSSGLFEIEQGEATHVSSEFVEGEISLMNREADIYKDHWERSGDASTIYRKLDQFAADAGVSVVRIEPSKSGVEIQREGTTISVVGFIVEVHGAFPDVLAYIELVQHQTGMTKFQSIRLYPSVASGQEGTVVATIQTEHVSAGGVFQTAEVTP